MPLRALLDTNVLVSGLIGRAGPPRELLDAWLDGCYILVTSLYQVQELNHVLSSPRIAERLAVTGPELDTILATMLSQAEVVVAQLDLSGVTRDPKDDPLVAAAVLGEVDYLVSGDQDLLVLEEYEGVKVTTPGEFVEILNFHPK
ncbi:MAG: putative toxin-antitoxin system toxin component, PIN family [Anaerolineae bacterium]|nr:putative toxin-antitoxin system toxin component, PIN family [Anaerolineae bacterium]